MEWYATPAFALYSNTEYEIVADSISRLILISLQLLLVGTRLEPIILPLAQVSISPSLIHQLSSGQHIVADAIR